MERYVIVGNGPAGLSAAETIRRLDPRGAIIMLSAEPFPSYSRVLLPYYLQGEIGEEQIFWRGREIANRLGVEERLGAGARTLDPSARTLTLANGETLSYTKLLLATGARPQRVEAPGHDLRGIHTLRWFAEARAIRREAEDAGRALVVGGGLVALKAALALRELGLEVTLAVSSPRILSRNLDRPAADLVQRHLEETGLKFRLNESVTAFLGNRAGRLQGASLTDGSEIPCGLAVIGKGVQPLTDLAEGAGLGVKGGILADRTMATTEPGIYAAGDAAAGLDPEAGKHRINSIWPSAVLQGKVAGSNMAGVRREMPGMPPMNAVVLAGLPLISAGDVDLEGPGIEVRTRSSASDRLYRKVILREGKLVGICQVGEVSTAGLLIGLLRAGTPVARPRHLLDDSLAYPYLGEATNSGGGEGNGS